jgi:L-2-hydroxyglutarate oxidase LhgO
MAIEDNLRSFQAYLDKCTDEQVRFAFEYETARAERDPKGTGSQYAKLAKAEADRRAARIKFEVTVAAGLGGHVLEQHLQGLMDAQVTIVARDGHTRSGTVHNVHDGGIALVDRVGTVCGFNWEGIARVTID